MKFDKRFIPDILSGRKTTTIRKARVVEEGDVVVLESGSKPFAMAYIKGIRKVRLCDLSEEEIRRDGFRSLDELLKALRRYYGHVDEEDDFFLIEFEVIKRLPARA